MLIYLTLEAVSRVRKVYTAMVRKKGLVTQGLYDVFGP